MKLYVLSGQPSKPCYVLCFNHTTVMLDCGLDVSTLLHYLPIPLVHSEKFSKLPGWCPREVPASVKLETELKECAGKVFLDGEPEFAIPEFDLVNMSEIDAILISNYHCMLALPYLTEYTNFRGVIYATDPTLYIGRQYMEEMVEYLSRSSKSVKATKWKQPNIISCLPYPLRDAVLPTMWRQCYNKHDIQACLSKVQTVGFNEHKDVFGALDVMAVSSGFCLGSSNWVICSQYDKISYLSGSSTLTTHPRPMEQSALKNSDVLIMCCLTQTPTANPDTMIGEFCVNTALTLKNGGNVLVPCYSSGVVYDLLECLSGHLESMGLGGVPLYFVSPVADKSLAYSNIYAEWLSQDKQSKIYLPESPFPHAELIKTGRLQHFSSLHDGFSNEMHTPCVVFCGHPSLRFGDAVHLVEVWGKSSSNTVIFTEPDFPYLEALAPFQPLAMKVSYCPIDTSLSFAQANKLIKELKPLHLIVPKVYLSPPLMLHNRTDLVIDTDYAPLSFKRRDMVTIPVKRRYEKLDLHPELAATLLPTEVKPGVAVATVTGYLHARDNKYLLKAVEDTKDQSRIKNPTHLWGNLDIQEFVKKLKEHGVTDIKVEDSPGGHIVLLQNDDTLIQIENGSTHVICQGNEHIRKHIRDVLLTCLQKF